MTNWSFSQRGDSLAPYITHLVVAEQVYAWLWDRDDYLGEFLYGSIAPDVSAESDVLTRRHTHFVGPYREEGEAIFRQSTATFLARYQAFTARPPRMWSDGERAFLEGYLCHLAADEVWRFLLISLWEANRERFAEVGEGPLLSLLQAATTEFDGRAARRLANPGRVLEALQDSAGIDLLSFLDPEQGGDFKRRVCDYLAAGGGIEAFLKLARGAGESEAWLQRRRRQFLEHREQVEQLLEDLSLDSFFPLAVERSVEMIERFRKGREGQSDRENFTKGFEIHDS
jgi:hypothetical protein